jgi:branched-chain amino acid transport system substrate-binding protein
VFCKKIAPLSVFVMLFVFLTACQKKEFRPLAFETATQEDTLEEQQAPQELRIGILLPLSGSASKLGDAMRQAAVLAQFEFGGDHLILQFYDTKGTPEGAKMAAYRALEEKSRVFIGPVFSKEVEAVGQIALDYQIPVLSFTSDISVLSLGVWTTGLSPEDQVRRIISYACEQGKRKLAVMYPSTPSGELSLSAAEKSAQSCEGMEIVRSVSYAAGTINFDPAVVKLVSRDIVNFLNKKESEKTPEEVLMAAEFVGPPLEKVPMSNLLDFDALFIADDGNRLKSVASLLSFYDVTAKVVPFLGSSLWQDESLSQETALIGGLFPSLTQNGYKAFVKKYEEAYGEKPLALSGYAYESVALVSMLSKKAEEEKKSFEEILLNPNGFKGIYGLFRLLPNGQVERMMNISRILPRGRFQIIQTAPVAFPKPEEEEPILEEESSLSE